MSDREAFVAAIAANPADDLPRLVFADWLDEHGDPERAEFIRTQIRWHHADADERKHLDVRAGELFREHWQRWFGAFLHALDPEADIQSSFRIQDSFAASNSRIDSAPPLHSILDWVEVERGFVKEFRIEVPQWSERALIADAIRREPFVSLTCDNGLPSPEWSRFTDPALRRVTELHLTQSWDWGSSVPESTALLEDPHLAGVRKFSMHRHNNLNGRCSGGTFGLPEAWLNRFVRSSLAYRLNDLTLAFLAAGGIAPLCRPGRLRLNKLMIYHSHLSADDVRRLGVSELPQALVALCLSGGLDDAGVGVLARDHWPKLRELDLSNSRLTAAVLPALAAAAFVPQLEVLNLSKNSLIETAADLNGLKRLADMLDPTRLRKLNLRETGLTEVPDFLAERFGDRVVV